MKTSPNLRLRKTARIHDQSKGNYLERIQFNASSGETVSIELLPSIVNDRRTFAKHLRDAGAILPKDKIELKTLLEEVANTKCDAEIVYADRAGWTKHGKAFIRPDRTIGESSKRIVGFKRSKAGDSRGVIKRAGSVTTWKSSVARPAQTSSILMFSIAVAFAPALLKMMKMGSFGFCLFGQSRSGKTLATLAAGSVIGNGSVEHLLDWNTTDKRLQEQLPEANDCLAPIDDLMSMAGTDRQKYARVKSLSYIIALGAGTGRHSSFAAESNDNWRTIVLTSNEISLQELAARGRQTRDPGETVRLIDVPATFDDLSDIFDRGSGNTLSWDRWFAACGENQGHVFETFLTRLIARKPQVRAVISSHAKHFSASVNDTADGNFARDIATKFGAVYSAGRLAIEFGLVPWKIADFTEAINKCYFAARDLLPDEGVTFRGGKRALLVYLQTLPERDDIDLADCSSLDGFHQMQTRNYRCMVKREKFTAIFSSVTQCKLVMDWLIDNKRVTRAVASTGPVRVKEQHIWPDGRRYRSVEIFWPRRNV
jgi:hypothetical protein